MIGMGEQWRELRPEVEGRAGAEIVGNKAEGEIGNGTVGGLEHEAR